MQISVRRLICATCLSPLMVVPVSAAFSLWYMLQWVGRELPDPAATLIWPHPFKPWETILLYSIYGVPTALASLLMLGLPMYLIAARIRRVSYLAACGAACLASIPATFFFTRGESNVLSMWLYLSSYGMAISICFIWIMRFRKQNQEAP